MSEALKKPERVETETVPQMEITVIPTKNEQEKINVAAYARVSTLTEEQEESFETQVSYYTTLIQKNPRWNFVEVYADNGRSGLSAEKRPEFMRMIQDALDGKIQLILVKSISRFGRDSLEAQTYVHKLKEHNIEVRFERENISSFNPQADMIFNFMTAIAEQESRSISDNVRWAYEKLGEQGIRHIGSNRLLGYDEENGLLVPNENAWIPELIFTEYAKGKSLADISRFIDQYGGKRLRSKKAFTATALLAILQNEIYVGDHRIQKAPHTDMKTKRPGEEEYESYYVENDHKGVISRYIWEKVQERLEKEKRLREMGLRCKNHSHFLYGKLFCGECGEPMVRKTSRVKSGQKKYWICRGRKKGAKGNGCRNEVIDEEEVIELLCGKLGVEDTGEIERDIEKIEAVKVYADRIEIQVKCQVA